MFVSPRGWVLAPTDLQVVSVDKVGSYCYVTSLFMGCPQFAEQWLSKPIWNVIIRIQNG